MCDPPIRLSLFAHACAFPFGAEQIPHTGIYFLLLEAHMDTVFPEGTDVKVVNKGDTLYAPRIADDTRGLAAILTLVKPLNQSNIKMEADVLFVGTTGEEGQGDLKGVKNLFSAASPSKNDTTLLLMAIIKDRKAH